MPKSSGFKGWKRRSLKHYEMYVNEIKVADAKIKKKANKWHAKLKVALWEINGALEDKFEQFDDALKWLNNERQDLSKRVFG
jgi:hypothetical protein